MFFTYEMIKLCHSCKRRYIFKSVSSFLNSLNYLTYIIENTGPGNRLMGITEIYWSCY